MILPVACCFVGFNPRHPKYCAKFCYVLSLHPTLAFLFCYLGLLSLGLFMIPMI